MPSAPPGLGVLGGRRGRRSKEMGDRRVSTWQVLLQNRFTLCDLKMTFWACTSTGTPCCTCFEGGDAFSPLARSYFHCHEKGPQPSGQLVSSQPRGSLWSMRNGHPQTSPRWKSPQSPCGQSPSALPAQPLLRKLSDPSPLHPHIQDTQTKLSQALRFGGDWGSLMPTFSKETLPLKSSLTPTTWPLLGGFTKGPSHKTSFLLSLLSLLHMVSAVVHHLGAHWNHLRCF